MLDLLKEYPIISSIVIGSIITIIMLLLIVMLSGINNLKDDEWED